MASRQSSVTDQTIIASLNRGPISSLFIHPSSCTATFTFAERNGGKYGDLYFGHHGAPVSAGCYPTGTSSSSTLDQDTAWRGYYYSPAICPSGWTTVAIFSSSIPFYPSPHNIVLGPATTAALCCPAGFKYLRNGCQCQSDIRPGQTVTFFPQTLDTLKQNWVRGDAVTTDQLSTVVSGDGIPIMWQSTDAEFLARASAMTFTKYQSTASPDFPTVTPPSKSDSSDIAQVGGLLVGAKIGLGVGVPFVVIAGLTLAFCFWRRWKMRQTTNEQHRVIGVDKDTLDAPVNAGGGQVHKLHTEPEAYHSRHELPGVAHR